MTRGWPVGPTDFNLLINDKVFTNGSDAEVVAKLYQRLSMNQLCSITVLDFDGMQPPSMDDARRFGGCLNLSVNLEELFLTRAGVSDRACELMFATLDEWALPKLQKLFLSINSIGRLGVHALAAAASRGAMKDLRRCDLKYNDEVSRDVADILTAEFEKVRKSRNNGKSRCEVSI